MNCFYHNDIPAVGVCKSCSKGICKSCAIEVGEGIACKDSCEKDVESLNSIIRKNITTTFKVTSKAYKNSALLYALMGIAFIVIGIVGYIMSESMVVAYFFAPMGLIFLMGAYHNYKSGRQMGSNLDL